MKIIQVNFSTSNKAYAYYTDDESVVEGDVVVIDAPSTGLTCVKVVSTTETVEAVEAVGKWIVAKVDQAPYKLRLEKENRRRLLLAKIRKAKEEFLATSELEKLAEINPNVRGYVDELKSL